jgi:hypothetical protein
VAATACAGPYAFRQDPAYATLPRVNLTATAHTLGPELDRPVRELRYGVEFALARQQVAAASPYFDERLPVIHLDVVDRGAAPTRMDPMPPPYSSDPATSFSDTYTRADQGFGSAGVRQTRIIDVFVELSEPTTPDPGEPRAKTPAPEPIGQLRTLIVDDFASTEKTAEMIASLVQRRLAPLH